MEEKYTNLHTPHGHKTLQKVDQSTICKSKVSAVDCC